MGVKIEWVANGHCNLNTKLQAQLQNTLFLHSGNFIALVIYIFLWYLIILVTNHQPLMFLIGSQEIGQVGTYLVGVWFWNYALSWER